MIILALQMMALYLVAQITIPDICQRSLVSWIPQPLSINNIYKL